MLDHCCLDVTTPVPYHTPIPGGIRNGQWEGTNNMYFYPNRAQLADPIIPGGHMIGSWGGSNAYIAAVTEIVWTYDNWLWLYQVQHEYPNGQGNQHYVPAIVFHVNDYPNQDTCSAGHYDSSYYTTLPYSGAYTHSPCALGRNSELRIFPTAITNFAWSSPYLVQGKWYQDSGGLHTINVDDYYINIGPVGDQSPVRRDNEGKFCFDDNNKWVTWCP